MKFYKWLFLVSGAYVLLCIPLIFLAERFGYPQAPLHVTQFFMVVTCFVAGILFLRATKGSPFGALRWVAAIAVGLSSLWLLFVGYVMLTFDLSGM